MGRWTWPMKFLHLCKPQLGKLTAFRYEYSFLWSNEYPNPSETCSKTTPGIAMENLIFVFIFEWVFWKESRCGCDYTTYMQCHRQGGGGGGATGAVCPGPPNSARLISIRSGLSVTMTIDNINCTYCIIYACTFKSSFRVTQWSLG